MRWVFPWVFGVLGMVLLDDGCSWDLLFEDDGLV